MLPVLVFVIRGLTYNLSNPKSGEGEDMVSKLWARIEDVLGRTIEDIFMSALWTLFAGWLAGAIPLSEVAPLSGDVRKDYWPATAVIYLIIFKLLRTIRHRDELQKQIVISEYYKNQFLEQIKQLTLESGEADQLGGVR